MPLNTNTNVSLDKIRLEIGKGDTVSFSLNTAEDGGYVAINQCSPSKPVASNPASISEWINYDHNADCSGGEFQSNIIDINDTTTVGCNTIYNNTQALTNLSLRPATYAVLPGANYLPWKIKHAEKFTSILIKVFRQTASIGVFEQVFEYSGAGFVSWNLVATMGVYNGQTVPSSLANGWGFSSYRFSIYYNDGTGREILMERLLIQEP